MTASLSYHPPSARALQEQLKALLPEVPDPQVQAWLEPYTETLPTPHSSEYETLSKVLRALNPRLPTLLATAVFSNKLESLEREEIEARQARVLEGRGRGRRWLEAFLMRRNAQGKPVLNRAGITSALVAGVLLLTVGGNVFLSAREGQGSARDTASKGVPVTSTASHKKVMKNPSNTVVNPPLTDLGPPPSTSIPSTPLSSSVPTRDPVQQGRLVARIRAQQAHTTPTFEPVPSVSRRIQPAVVVAPKVLPAVQAMPVMPRVIAVSPPTPPPVSEVAPEEPRAVPTFPQTPSSPARGPWIRVTPRVEASGSRALRPLRVSPVPSVRITSVPSETVGETRGAMASSPLPRFVPAPVVTHAQPLVRALPSRPSSTPAPVPAQTRAVPEVAALSPEVALPRSPAPDPPYVPSSPPPTPNPAPSEASSADRGPLELARGDASVRTAALTTPPRSLELATGTAAPAPQAHSLELATGESAASSAVVSRVQAQLVSSVAVSSQTPSVPAMAVSQDGRSWSGQAQLEPDGRISLRFSQVQSAAGIQTVNTLASSSNGGASFDGGYHLEDAGSAGQLVGQGVGQLQDYAQKQVAEASGNNALVNTLTSSLLNLTKPQSRSSAQVGVASLPAGTVVLLEETH